MLERSCHLMLPSVCTLLLFLSSCTFVEQGIDRAAGPNDVSRTTVVKPPPEPDKQAGFVQEGKVPSGPLKISTAEAVLLCLENNRSLVVERLNPSIRQTFEEQERDAFDPVIGGEISAGRVRGQRLARSGSKTESYAVNEAEGVISLENYFPTGTAVSLEAGTVMSDSSLYDEKFYSNRIGMTVTQALLRGYGREVNLARLQQARLETRMSEYELRGFTEFLVAEVERTYWDYALSRRQIEIVEESLKVASQQLKETKELIEVGRLARAEQAAVRAEVAAQEQALIEARAREGSFRLKLLRLLNPAGPGIWQREIDLIHQPTLPEIELEEVDAHVALSERLSPILNEARLKIMQGDLEIVKTGNGLLPQMDLFITLGKSGYANSFGRSVSDMDEDSYDALAGLRFNYPFFNREAGALHRRALLSHEQTQKALGNLLQLAEVDVRTAYIEVNRTRQQIKASSVTRTFNEEKFRTETEKLRVGKSTSFLVAQAHRDLLASRINEVQALTNYLKALIDLYRLDGSLLERRGISAPGREPVLLKIQTGR